MNPGFWMLRMSRYGPEVPACILVLQTTHEPGDEANVMDRSPHLGAFIAGKSVETDRVWQAVKRPVPRWRYLLEMARIAYAQDWDPDEPMLAPRERVDFLNMKPVGPE